VSSSSGKKPLDDDSVNFSDAQATRFSSGGLFWSETVSAYEITPDVVFIGCMIGARSTAIVFNL